MSQAAGTQGVLPVEVLAAIARATASLVEPAELFQVLRTQTERLIETDAFYLALYDAPRQRLRFVMHSDLGELLPAEDRPLGTGPTSWVVRHRRTFVSSGPGDPVQAAANTFGSGGRSGSAIHAPMLLGDRLVGVLSAQAYRPGAYNADSVRMLEAVAAHAAIAIEAARIARTTRQAEGAARASLAASRVLRELAHDLAGMDGVEAVVERGLGAAMELLGADGATFTWRADEMPGVLTVLGVAGHEGRSHRRGDLLDTSALEASVLRTGVERVSRDLGAEPELRLRADRPRDSRPGIIIPVRIGWNVVGTLTVSSTETSWHQPVENERLMLRAVGDQVAAAVSAVRVREQLARRMEQIDALGRIAHTLTGVEDADRTMQFVAAEGMRVFGAERAAVYLVDRVSGRTECVVSIGLSQDYVDALMTNFRDAHSSTVLEQGQPLFCPDARLETRPSLLGALQAEGVMSTAALPLIFADETIGALCFYHDRGKVYSPDERRLATAFADQAALAIGKSRLLDQVIGVKREWQSAFDATGSGLAIVGADRRIVRANRFVADLAGVQVTELPGLNLAALFPTWPDPEHDPLAGAVTSNSTVAALIDGSGGRRFVVTAAPMAHGAVMVAIDEVTELVRLEQRFSRVVQTAHDAIVITGADRRISFANPAAAELLGRGLPNLVGRPIPEFLPEELGPDGLPSESSAPRRYEARVQRQDGEVRHLAISSAPLDETDPNAGAVAVMRDVTQERLAAEALRRSEARYRALFAAAPLSIFTLDEGGGFLSVNRATIRMAGLERREPNRKLQDFLLPAEQDYVAEHLTASFRGETRDFVFHFRRADGTVREAAAISVPVEGLEGTKAVLIIARDVTEELLLRKRLSHSEKLAALGQLVSGVAHELNNPLAGITAMAQAHMEDQARDSTGAPVLETIRREATRAARIVNDLLTFARQRPIERRDTDLNVIVREALQLGVHTTGGITWELNLADDLPLANADPDQIRQVISNLLANAEYAMREAPTKVGRIRTYTRDTLVGCEVSDSGGGVPPELMSRIFEPFFSTKGPGEGTGLGLSLSHGIVRAHGGEIRAQNRTEGGAAFCFELATAVGSEEYR